MIWLPPSHSRASWCQPLLTSSPRGLATGSVVVAMEVPFQPMRSMSRPKERLLKSFTRRMNSPSLPALAQEQRVAQSSAAQESVSTSS
ncbi:hypothetical protein D3C79_1019990 [compost metagenome]